MLLYTFHRCHVTTPYCSTIRDRCIQPRVLCAMDITGAMVHHMAVQAAAGVLLVTSATDKGSSRNSPFFVCA